MTVLEYIGTFSWEVVALMVLGIVLLVIEMMQPGIGVPGALGIVLIVIAIILQANTVLEAVIMLAVLGVIVGILFLIFARSIYKGKLSKSSVMLDDTGKPVDMNKKYDNLQVGDRGITVTLLRPVGTAVIHGKKLEVVSEGEFIEKGREIEVVSIEGIRVVVRPVEESKAEK